MSYNLVIITKFFSDLHEEKVNMHIVISHIIEWKDHHWSVAETKLADMIRKENYAWRAVFSQLELSYVGFWGSLKFEDSLVFKSETFKGWPALNLEFREWLWGGNWSQAAAD